MGFNHVPKVYLSAQIMQSMKGVVDVFNLMSSSLISFKNAMALTILMVSLICLGTLTSFWQAVAVRGSDKWHHFLAFAFLTTPFICVKVAYWMIIIPFALIFGAVIELIQPYLNRSGDIYDFYANATGVLIGLIIGSAVNVFYFRRLQEISWSFIFNLFIQRSSISRL